MKVDNGLFRNCLGLCPSEFGSFLLCVLSIVVGSGVYSCGNE